MRNILIALLLVFCLSLSIYGQVNNEDERFYYYNGEKIPLNINKNRLLVYYESNSDLDVSIFNNYEIEQEIG